ncbi:hypothetical protein HZA98_03175 [Candidatus Woesearchaeota archaeon]|nr:hypothetical protein [Candidatus Woesearchaeota archaeon]
MIQESLFSDPELRRIETLTILDRETLYSVAQRAAAHPLLYGDYKEATAAGRLHTIRSRLEGGPNSCNYLICATGVPIGYLSIWDGWDPHEMEFREPVIEFGFLDPEHKALEGILRIKVASLVPTLKDDGW